MKSQTTRSDDLHRPRGLVVILAVDVLLLAVIPLVLFVPANLVPVLPYGVAHLWYAPVNPFFGYFCWPVGLFTSPAYCVILIGVAWMSFYDRKAWGVLLFLIIAQNVLAVIGLGYHTELASWNEYMVDMGVYSRNLTLTWTRAIFSAFIIVLNVWYFLRERFTGQVELADSAAYS